MFKDFYESAFRVLSNDAAILAVVPVENIRPSNDPTRQVEGGLIVYGWSTSAEDRKARRATGTLNITCAATANKISAQDIIQAFRDAFTPRLVTDAKVTIHLAKEQQSTADEATDATGRFAVAAAYQIKMIRTPV